MARVNIHDTKTHLSRLIARVARIVIGRAGKPVAVLLPSPGAAARRVPGRDDGQILIRDDFDDPLPEFQG